MKISIHIPENVKSRAGSDVLWRTENINNAETKAIQPEFWAPVKVLEYVSTTI